MSKRYFDLVVQECPKLQFIPEGIEVAEAPNRFVDGDAIYYVPKDLFEIIGNAQKDREKITPTPPNADASRIEGILKDWHRSRQILLPSQPDVPSLFGMRVCVDLNMPDGEIEIEQDGRVVLRVCKVGKDK